jgi:RNA polymerase sigma-70 factor (ECF subfamily)
MAPTSSGAALQRQDLHGDVAAIRTGEGPRFDHFEDLFAAESRRLFGALCLITRDIAEAEDVGQEAFVRVLERWDRVGSMADPVGYLYRVAMNVFRSRCRRARVAARRRFSDHRVDEIAEIEDRDAINRMLVTLSPRQRAALVLTSVLDYSSEEAGEILGVSSTSVRVLSTRARASLRSGTWEDA